MMQQEKQANELEAFIQRCHDETNEGSRAEPEETYHIYPVPGGMVILKEDPEDQSINATPPQHRLPSSLTYAAVFFAFMLPLASILFQVHLGLHPPTVTVTLMPRVQTMTVTGTVHMGRLIPPVTLSQSATTPTTGRGHRAAAQARGTITLYNGQFTAQTVPAGTIITGADGAHVITDFDALIPAGNPPSYGQATIAAHTVQAGRKGNIPAYDINTACCFASVLAKNPEPFTGGEDERTFQTVATRDIASTAAPLKLSLAHIMQGALQEQRQPNEQLFLLPCTPATASDRQAGDEATSVTVTVSETCSAAVYNRAALSRKAQQLLSHLAANKGGSHYRLFGQAHVTITQVTASQQNNLVVLSITAQGTFVSVLSTPELEHLKKLITGKTAHEALLLLKQTPGIQDARLAGTGETTNLPRNASLIQFVLLFRS
jgi:hypothetical protein